jgi:hypothetical protein
MGGREAAYREHKDALRARSEAQKHFGIGSAEWIVANTRVENARRISSTVLNGERPTK